METREKSQIELPTQDAIFGITSAMKESRENIKPRKFKVLKEHGVKFVTFKPKTGHPEIIGINMSLPLEEFISNNTWVAEAQWLGKLQVWTQSITNKLERYTKTSLSFSQKDGRYYVERFQQYYPNKNVIYLPSSEGVRYFGSNRPLPVISTTPELNQLEEILHGPLKVGPIRNIKRLEKQGPLSISA